MSHRPQTFSLDRSKLYEPPHVMSQSYRHRCIGCWAHQENSAERRYFGVLAVLASVRLRGHSPPKRTPKPPTRLHIKDVDNDLSATVHLFSDNNKAGSMESIASAIKQAQDAHISSNIPSPMATFGSCTRCAESCSSALACTCAAMAASTVECSALCHPSAI